jgi:hypothetical protein
MSSSKARILSMHRTHPLRPWVVAGTCAAVAVAAWTLLGDDDATDTGRVTVLPHGDAAPAASVAAATVRDIAVPLPASAPVVARTPVPAASQAAAPAPLALRAAIDSGRAQPVFLALMGARSARVGQLFKLDITAESENDVAGGALVVEFDASRMKVVAVRPGAYMAQAGAQVAVDHAVDAQAGRLTIDVAEQEGGPPVSGGGTLVTVEFMPTQRGQARVALSSAVLRDLRNEGVPASVSGAHSVAID